MLWVCLKENCPDLRNTKVVDIIHELRTYNMSVDVTDPLCSSAEALSQYGIELTVPVENKYDAIVLAVSHQEFRALGVEKIRSFGRRNHILYDLKYLFPKDSVDMRL